ncbi:MAG TPA: hypothetical protein VFP44_14490 [Usitatibacter sp.]|nr:hypothetical protein [Usitatibacter sp.]
MRVLLAAFALALAVPAQAATSFSTDVTDLWWNPDESGWGVNLIQQNNIVFATFFVYDANNRAHWYVASSMTATTASASGATFQGDLFESNGPWFGVPFNAAGVARNRVGTATLQVAFPASGIITYTVNGATVTKAIRRQTWAANDASGTYEGARTILSASSSGCNIGSSSFSGIRIAQSQATFSMSGNLAGASCQFNGDYSQDGHLGASSGTFSCSDGFGGTYALGEIETTLYGFMARYSGSERNCTVSGRIGGVRTTIIRQVAQ